MKRTQAASPSKKIARQPLPFTDTADPFTSHYNAPPTPSVSPKSIYRSETGKEVILTNSTLPLHTTLPHKKVSKYEISPFWQLIGTYLDIYWHDETLNVIDELVLHILNHIYKSKT